MHDARGELPDRRELLGLRRALQRALPLGDVLADRHDVLHDARLVAHRDLRQAVRAQLARRPRVELQLLHLSRREHLVELLAHQRGVLPRHHVEDRAPEGGLARQALRADLALAIPELHLVVAIDDVDAERKRVDDLLDEPTLLVHLRRVRVALRRQRLGLRRVAAEQRQQVHDGTERSERVGRAGSREDEHRDRAIAEPQSARAEVRGGVQRLALERAARGIALRRHLICPVGPAAREAAAAHGPDRGRVRASVGADGPKRLREDRVGVRSGGGERDQGGEQRSGHGTRQGEDRGRAGSYPTRSPSDKMTGQRRPASRRIGQTVAGAGSARVRDGRGLRVRRMPRDAPARRDDPPTEMEATMHATVPASTRIDDGQH